MNLAMMLTLADSRLPVGGHVHSGGIEQAIADGLVRDVASVRDFLIRRVDTAGLVGASVAVAVTRGVLTPDTGDAEMDARTPSGAARNASRAQGRGMMRLAKTVWPQHDWSTMPMKPHLPVIAGGVAAVSGLDAAQCAGVLVYTTMTSSATAAQRLLGLDPAAVTAIGIELAPRCDEIAARACEGLSDLSDPLLDILAEKHVRQDMPLFAS